MSRSFSRLNYNLKIRGGKELYGRRQFKLRADSIEPSYMRTKLISDIHNRLGIPSLSANYCTLYINDEYMGLYIFTDAYKETWIEYVYGEKDTTQLYKCDMCDLSIYYRMAVTNENKDITDTTEIDKFLNDMTKATRAADVESFFDVEQFTKEMVIDFLTSSWDHLVNFHNYYLYKNPQTNKWIYLSYDFDFDMGYNNFDVDDVTMVSLNNINYPNVVKNLILNDDRLFRKTLMDIVTNAFNPGLLFPRIDELKAFIEPYVKLDKTPNAEGQYPGRINTIAPDFYTYEQWEESLEYMYDYSNIGLKRFILNRYEFICNEFSLECDPEYLSLEI